MSRHIENLRKIFNNGVKSVQPSNLFAASNSIKQIDVDVIKINDHTINLSNKKCHIVGFGKAVIGMAVQMERILAERLKSGIISIPVGTLEKFRTREDMQLNKNTVMKVFEGAENNFPDEKALEAALKIKLLAKSMNNDDILFVLISGGGSALLPLPTLPLTLTSKLAIIKKLASQGATIEEINIVRIAISDIKGGKLTAAAKNANQIISLVISDIVGDPLHLIASGPTVPYVMKPEQQSAEEILKKFSIWSDIEHEVREICKNSNSGKNSFKPENNIIQIIGNNKVAANVTCREAKSLYYYPSVLSTSIQGNIKDVCKIYVQFLETLRKFKGKKIRKDQFLEEFPFDKSKFEELVKNIESSQNPLLLILAGEPTVSIKGQGIGGRNQELALRMALECYRNDSLKEVCFLSAGTDGIDGPTPAAGAIGCSEVVDKFLKTNTLEELDNFIDNNDSFNFYNCLENGQFHIVTGHTGTNVMDLHLIVVPNL